MITTKVEMIPIDDPLAVTREFYTEAKEKFSRSQYMRYEFPLEGIEYKHAPTIFDDKALEYYYLSYYYIRWKSQEHKDFWWNDE
jgi:hypothetical protein